MAEEPDPTALRRKTEQRASLFLAIGEFIYEFSQLEFTIRHVLGIELGLDGGARFDAVIAPYDFATLCRVTRTILEQTCTRPEDAIAKAEIASVFNDCAKLNEERVRIAHGTWRIEGGARVVSRTTLQAKSHFEKPDKITEKARVARSLQKRVVLILGTSREELGKILRRRRGASLT